MSACRVCAGRIAECPSADGRYHVFYGSEWDVGLLVDERSVRQRAATFGDLQKEARINSFLAFGSSSAGLVNNQDLTQAADDMAADIAESRLGRLPDSFLVAFDRSRIIASAALAQANSLQPIGYLAEPVGGR
ncbi:MAG TPA: hypothetical protein VGH55_07320 [Chthoniobacterales bacterium]